MSEIQTPHILHQQCRPSCVCLLDSAEFTSKYKPNLIEIANYESNIPERRYCIPFLLHSCIIDVEKYEVILAVIIYYRDTEI